MRVSSPMQAGRSEDAKKTLGTFKKVAGCGDEVMSLAVGFPIGFQKKKKSQSMI